MSLSRCQSRRPSSGDDWGSELLSKSLPARELSRLSKTTTQPHIRHQSCSTTTSHDCASLFIFSKLSCIFFMTGSMYVLMQCWKWWPGSAWRTTTEQPFLWLGRTPIPLNFKIFKLESYIWLYIASLIYKQLEMSSSTSLFLIQMFVHGLHGFAAGDVETAHTRNFESIPDRIFKLLLQFRWVPVMILQR